MPVKFMKNRLNLGKSYQKIKVFVINSGFGEELRWQEHIEFDGISESDFLRELAWVILSAGMSEKVIRKHFQDISLCFYDWESAEKIIEMEEFCREFALRYFNNHRKISAIIESARIIAERRFENLKESFKATPIDSLIQFPFIGPITAYHLAKNLGLPFAKADRHLSRLSNSAGYEDVQEFCNTIAELTGDAIQVVDLVLWRFATIQRNYIDCFVKFSR